MLSGKAQASTKPTAMGSLLQAATYGQTIPVGYGMTQSPLLAIWAANLRQGGSVKKFKQFIKGITSYVENIDFLLGHNPIIGVQQLWNNGSPIPLNFVSQVVAGGGPNFTVVDPNFYAVIGVTITVDYGPVVVNDYGGFGPQTLSGSYEVPCWNELFAGPDLIAQQNNYPYVYRWEPSYGATIYLDGLYQAGVPSPGTVTIYYSQLVAATSFLPPLQKMRLAFEPQLGSGSEYADAGNDLQGQPYTNQQIIYPMFAGLGSSSFDLGSGGVIPSVTAEVQFKFGLYPTGDADFVDMIVDVFESGVAQAAIGDPNSPGFTPLEHGLSSYDFPGPVQSKFATSVEAYTSNYPFYFNLPVTQGNFLVAMVVSNTFIADTPTITDNMGNVWTPVLGTLLSYQLWWAQANANGQCGITIVGQGVDWSIQLFEIGGVDTFDSATVGTSPTVVTTTTNQQGFPEYILAVSIWAAGAGSYNPAPNIPLWTPLNPPATITLSNIMCFGRQVETPGTYSFTNPQVSFNPSSVASLCFKCAISPPSYPQPLGSFLDAFSLECVRNQCRANGLWGSLTMTSQQAASDWLETLYQAADAAPVFMGFRLFSVPYSEVSIAGNGAIYYAPTACGPVANLSTENGDFISQGNAPPITVKTAARVDQPNVLQMQCINRESNYNPSVVAQPDAASISLFGVRKADPVVNNAIQDVSIARQLLGIMVRKLQYGGDVYSFTLPAKWVLLTPMDLVTVTDPLASINQIPVRLTSIVEQSDGSLECEAEPFVYGMYDPSPLVTDVPGGSVPIIPAGDQTPVNAPIIFEPVPGLIGSANQGQIWLVVSSSDPNYGGAQVYISTDGGASYTTIGNPIVGNAIQGLTAADWPASSSPDTTNDLMLDLTQSGEALQSYAVATEDQFVIPSYVGGGGSGGGGAAPFVQGASNYTAGGADGVLAFPSNNSAGNCLIVDIFNTSAFAGAPSINSVTDSQGNTYTQVGSNGPALQTWVAPNCLAGANTVTAHWSTTPSGSPYSVTVVIHEYGDILPTSPVDNVASTSATVAATIATSVTATASPDVLHIVAAVNQTSSVTVPFTDTLGATVRETLQAGSGGGGVSLTSFDIKVAGATTFSETVGFGGLSASFSWLNIVALKTGAGGGGGATAIPYELMSYAVATLTAPNLYTLSATGGNHLNRGVFGAPMAAQGVDHPAGAAFALLTPDGQGILKLPLQTSWVGETLYFKIVPVTTFGTQSGDLSTATAYPYVVSGTSPVGEQGVLVNGS